jgi:nuclear RNA export factor
LHNYSFSAVHKIFPRVNYLDGIAVARNPFLFPDEDEVLQTSKLPPFKPGFSPGPELRQLVEKFLSEYFNIYDGPEGAVTRQQLFAAYDANATFTYAINTLPDTMRVPYGDDETFGIYIKSSHNIMQESKWERYREKIIYRGAMDVANCISKLPLTNHILDTFILDITTVTQEMMVFTLQGLLRDGPEAFSSKEGDVKFFCRSFVVLPRPDNKIAIINDMLQLTPIVVGRMIRYKTLITKAIETEAQQKPGPSGIQAALQPTDTIGQMTIESANASAPPPSPSQASSAYDKSDPAIQRAMIEQFSQQSGMKLEWSRQCLEDQNWDFEMAGRRFLELRDSIPPEAFI